MVEPWLVPSPSSYVWKASSATRPTAVLIIGFMTRIPCIYPVFFGSKFCIEIKITWSHYLQDNYKLLIHNVLVFCNMIFYLRVCVPPEGTQSSMITFRKDNRIFVIPGYVFRTSAFACMLTYTLQVSMETNRSKPLRQTYHAQAPDSTSTQSPVMTSKAVFSVCR